jgi:hypothetical protein
LLLWGGEHQWQVPLLLGCVVALLVT